jgi:dCMP deaminase
MNWDKRFLDLCIHISQWSKDPSTRVGAVVVSPDRQIVSTGYNGFPRGLADTEERLGDRDTKLQLVIHGEMNCITQAARYGISLKGCTMYTLAVDANGTVWGSAPCTRCAVHVIQAGIREVVSFTQRDVPDRWLEDVNRAKAILEESGVSFREVEI